MTRIPRGLKGRNELRHETNASDSESIKDRVSPELKNLSPHQLWLLEHQMTAFWHGFGISNGLDVPPDMVEEIRYPSGEKRVRVKKEFMRQQLEEYNNWLRSYDASWNIQSSADVYPKNFDDFLAHEMAVHWRSRKPIFDMINLLQDSKSGKGAD